MLALDSVLLGNSVDRIVALSVFTSVRIADAASDLSEKVNDAGISRCPHGEHGALECAARLPNNPGNLSAKLVLVIAPIRQAGGDH